MIRAAAGRVLDRLEKLFPARAAARVRYTLCGRNYFFPFGSAMNGQTSRLEAARQMLYRCGVRQIVETGTFRGTTTEWLAGFGLPVVTIEANPRSYYFAKLRLGCFRNVRVEFGSSVTVLQSLVGRIDTSVPTFFYLDAHWEDYLPLGDEMGIILSHFAAPLILIDDFQVPGQPGYGYDDYGPGKALTAEYLRRYMPPGMEMFYPSVLAEQETGRRRGWVVVSPDARMKAELNRMDLLRKHV